MSLRRESRENSTTVVNNVQTIFHERFDRFLGLFVSDAFDGRPRASTSQSSVKDTCSRVFGKFAPAPSADETFARHCKRMANYRFRVKRNARRPDVEIAEPFRVNYGS